MSDQSVSNERRRELEQMDPFQEALAKSLAYASENRKQLFLILGAVVVVCVVFSAIMFNFKRSEIAASRVVADATRQYGETYAKDQDYKKGYNAVKDSFQSVFDDYSNTNAGRLALVTFAKICFDAEEYDKAYALYLNALDILGNEAGMENFLLSALGNLSQIKGEPEKAKSYYLRIEKGSSDLLKDEARFSLALLYEADNDMEASLKMYEKILKENENSIYRAIAESKVAGS